jgi:hypothetical protein
MPGTTHPARRPRVGCLGQVAAASHGFGEITSLSPGPVRHGKACAC